MKKELEDKLFESFPNLYRFNRKNSDIRKNLMCFGFECGDGWFNILFDLSKRLEDIINTYPENERKNIYATQVKEKYGTLRFYLSSETDEMSLEIDRAENLSETTCEVCGNSGKINGKGWLSVRCKDHLNE